jgi:hypothetical protein
MYLLYVQYFLYVLCVLLPFDNTQTGGDLHIEWYHKTYV